MEFKLIDECVLAFIPGLREPRTIVPSTEPYERAKHENFENHQHFDYAFGSTAYERWQNNLAAVVDEQERYLDGEIVPALRMWSTENDPDMEMHKGFCVDDSRLDVLCLNIDHRPVFVPANEVFTRAGYLRQSILARGAGAGREKIS